MVRSDKVVSSNCVAYFLGGIVSTIMAMVLYERRGRRHTKDHIEQKKEESKEVNTTTNPDSDYEAALRKIAELEQRNRELDEQRYQERQGRIHSERALRKGSPFHYDANESIMSSSSVKAFPALAIGTLTTCFHLCKATPRQGYIAPSTRGIIMLHDGPNAVLQGRKGLGGWTRACQGQVPHVQDKVLREKQDGEEPVLQYAKGEAKNSTATSSGQGTISGSALDGLEQFSHVWIIYGFHSNTQLHKSHLAAHAKGYKFVAKISPPVLKGKKMGIFATRSPHRPSSIGLSVARVLHVDKKKGWLHVAGVDMLDGTPVLDIKPYIPHYDAIPDAIIPKWVNESAIGRDNRTPVYFSHQLFEDLDDVLNRGDYRPSVLHSMETVVEVIEQILGSDVRSAFQRGGADSRKGKSCEYELLLDGLRILYVRCRGAEVAAVLDQFFIHELMVAEDIKQSLKTCSIPQKNTVLPRSLDQTQGAIAVVTGAVPISAKASTDANVNG